MVEFFFLGLLFLFGFLVSKILAGVIRCEKHLARLSEDFSILAALLSQREKR